MKKVIIDWERIWYLFHECWGRCKESKEYQKSFWNELQSLLEDVEYVGIQNGLWLPAGPLLSDPAKVAFDRLQKPEAQPDMVNHPPHYNFAGPTYEVIKVLSAWKLGPLEWQVVKYVARARHKGQELQDLKKAQFYLNYRIQELESGQ